MTTIGTTSDSEWYDEWQQMTTSDNDWYKEWRVTTNDNEWQRGTISAIFFFFFQIREEATTKHPKENSLNIEEELWRRPTELRAEKTLKKKY